MTFEIDEGGGYLDLPPLAEEYSATEEEMIADYVEGVRALASEQFDLAMLDEVHRRLRHAAVKDDTASECYWSKCEEPSIRRSHVISRRIGIDVLGEKNEVVTPERLLRNLEPHPERTASASTFPGYCETHEKRFRQFELKGRLSTTSDYLLQAVRSADREVWWALARIDFYTALTMELQDQIDLIEDAGARALLKEKVLVPLSGLRASIDITCAGMSWLRSDMREALEAPAHLPSHVRIFQDECPTEVAVSGSTVHRFTTRNGMVRGIEMLLISMPNAGGRLTIIASTKDEDDALNDYVADALSGVDARTAFIEEWMATTDHWFARPSWWISRTEDEKKRILRSLKPFLITPPPPRPPHRDRSARM